MPQMPAVPAVGPGLQAGAGSHTLFPTLVTCRETSKGIHC